MCTVMDYFGIFLERMMMCRRAARKCLAGALNWLQMEASCAKLREAI